MKTDTYVPEIYTDAVRVLARWHAEGEGFASDIYSFPDPDGRVVQLIEVSDAFSAKHEVSVVRFGASEGFPFATAVALVTPEMWTQIRKGDLALPQGWALSECEQVWPE